jgi:hypothetical protein
MGMCPRVMQREPTCPHPCTSATECLPFIISVLNSVLISVLVSALAEIYQPLAFSFSSSIVSFPHAHLSCEALEECCGSHDGVGHGRLRCDGFLQLQLCALPHAPGQLLISFTWYKFETFSLVAQLYPRAISKAPLIRGHANRPCSPDLSLRK